METKDDEAEDRHAILDRLAAKARPARIREVSQTAVVLPIVLVEMVVDYCTYDSTEWWRNVNLSGLMLARFEKTVYVHCQLVIGEDRIMNGMFDDVNNGVRCIWHANARISPRYTIWHKNWCPFCVDQLTKCCVYAAPKHRVCRNHSANLHQRLTILDFDPGLGQY
jgi:hypothetical protein